MKKTRIWAGTALVLLFTLLHAACAFANTTNMNGHLDSIVGNAVAGWVWDSESPETSQTVTVSVTNKFTGEVVFSQTAEANEHREDLKSNGIGTGDYGFHIAVDWNSLPEAIYAVSLASGGTTLPKTLQYTNGNVDTSAYGNLIPLGTFKTTAYCPCRACSEGWGRHTSSGTLATANHTVAVDPKVIPIGSHLLIGGEEYVAEDIGGAVKGKHIDVFFDTHAETRIHGTQNEEVYLIQR